MSTRHQMLEREVTLDDLLADPIMSVLWRADHLTEGDVRHIVADVSSRLQATQNAAAYFGTVENKTAA